MNVRRALLSVSDKSHLLALARVLVDAGAEILSTGGTAALLEKEGLRVTRVSEYTGAPEILGGRVKSLHPKIHGGILARRDVEEDLGDLDENDIGLIDLVVVNLYPFRKTVADPEASFADAIENIDIGGPTMVRAAAKNFAHVAVVVDPADYPRIQEAIAAGGIDEALRYELARKAFAHTADYDEAICEYLSSRAAPDAKPSAYPDTMAQSWQKAQDLRYGENPHQRAAFYLDEPAPSEPVIAGAEQLQGKALSFNNLLDADAALEIVKEFDETAAVVIKHTNPCGVAVGEALATTYRDALACDPVSAFGGVVALNREVDDATAEALAETFLEIVVAPGFTKAARERLGKKKNLRLLELPALATDRASWVRGGLDLKKVGGGLLVQDRNIETFPAKEPEVVSKRAPTEEEWKALRFAWRVCKHVKSNAIVFTSDRQLVGVGAGQMSRVDSSKIAVMRAVLPIEGTVVGSDAFFPFRDGVEAAADAGATAVIQPGGSKRDAEVIEAADERGMAMVFTGMRHFRH